VKNRAVAVAVVLALSSTCSERNVDLGTVSQAVVVCTNDVCVENSRTDGVTLLPEEPIAETETAGYAYPASINRFGPNNQLQLRIKSPLHTYRIQIMRLGYYGGGTTDDPLRARIVATLDNGGSPFSTHDQPDCHTESRLAPGPYNLDPGTKVCGDVGTEESRATDSCPDWIPRHTWTHPSSLPSGVYLAHVVNGASVCAGGTNPGTPCTDASTCTGGTCPITLASIPFTVRDDSGTSSVMVQVPDTTWQAYDKWGDQCHLPGIGAVYVGPPTGFWSGFATGGRIRRARWDRPYADQQWAQGDMAPYVRFFEKLGANVSYISAHDLDVPQSESLLIPDAGVKRVFVIAAHDEYWSQERRNGVERARNAGVHMMFLTGNDVHWRTQVTGPDELHITKDSSFYPGFKTQADWTGLWGDTRYQRSTNGDATGPENATGGLVSGAWGRHTENPGDPDPVRAYHWEVQVSAEEGRHRFWRNTPYATVGADGGTAIIATPANLRVVEGEWDMDSDNGFRPLGLSYLSSTATVGNHITKGQELPVRSNMTSQVTHHMVIFRNAQGAITFHAGTTDFSNAIDQDAPCNGGTGDGVHRAALQRGIVNLMADMGLPQPDRLCDGWWSPPPAKPAPPTGTVAAVVSARMGRSVELRGTATASPGATVAAVEVGIAPPGASSFRYAPAAGRGSWVYDWTPPAPSPNPSSQWQIRVRVTDDFGQTTESSITSAYVAPTARLYDDSDTFAAFSSFGLEQWRGTKFSTSVAGTVSEIRVWMPDSLSYYVRLVDVSTSQSLMSGWTQAQAGWRSLVFSPVSLDPDHYYAVVMKVPMNRLYPYVPTSAFSRDADAPPLKAYSGLQGNDWTPSQLTEVQAGFAVDVVFDASAYWSTTTTTKGWFPSSISATLQPPSGSALEQRTGYEWVPTSDGYVDGIRIARLSGDTNNYLVELHATPAQHLFNGPAIIAAVPVPYVPQGPQGTITVPFDKPARVFRAHAYRLVIQVEKAGTVGDRIPMASSSPASTASWLSSLSKKTALCDREDEYNTCAGVINPQYTYTTYQATISKPAIDVAFRPTAAFRQSLWPRTGVTPMKTSTGVAGAMGTMFQSPSDGYVDGIRFYDKTPETTNPTVRLHSCIPNASANWPFSCSPSCETTGTPIQDASNWYTVRFERPCAIKARTDYIASVYLPSGNLAYTDNYFQRPDPQTGAEVGRRYARNLYEEGFLVASASGAVEDDDMPEMMKPCAPASSVGPPESEAQCNDAVDSDDDDIVNDGCPSYPLCTRVYFVEPIVRDGR
jgi:hypothetical protein